MSIKHSLAVCANVPGNVLLERVKKPERTNEQKAKPIIIYLPMNILSLRDLMRVQT